MTAKDPAVLREYLAECVRSEDWHGVRDAAADIEIAESEIRANSRPDTRFENTFRMALTRISEALDMPGSPDLALDVPRRVEEYVMKGDALRRALDQCGRIAMDFAIRAFFGEEPKSEEVSYKDGAPPEELVKIVIREFQRALARVQEASFSGKFREKVFEALNVDEENDALRRLRELGQVRISTQPPLQPDPGGQ